MRHAKRDTTRGEAALFLSLHYNVYHLSFSQPTERAGTHAGVWKQEFPPAMRGVWGASPPHSRVHAQQILRIPATVARRREPPPMPFAYSAA